MKKQLQWVLAAILTLCGTTLFSGCSDTIDNPVRPTEDTVNPITEEAYENDALMDRTVKPGDSFYDFAFGTWLKTHDEADKGLQDNFANQQAEVLEYSFNNSDDPLVQQLLGAADEVEDEEAFAQQILSLLAELHLISDTDEQPTREQFVELLAKMMDSGYSPFVKWAIDTNDGLYVRVLTAGHTNRKVKKAMKTGDEEGALAIIKEMLGLIVPVGTDDDDSNLDQLAHRILEIEQVVTQAQNDGYDDDLRVRRHATPKRALKAAQFRARRAAADGMTETDILQTLGLSGDYSLIDEQVEPVVNLLLESDVETLGAYLGFHIVEQFYSLKPLGLDDLNAAYGYGYYDIGNGVRKKLYSYLLTKAPEIVSRIDYDILKNYIDIEGCRTMMEQMRTLMDQRITNLDWMSDATKQAARGKLAAMKFNIGVPDTRPGGSLTLTGKTLLEDVQQLRQQRYQRLMALVGESVAEHGWENILQSFPLGTVNACYFTNLNQLFILPAFISNALFPKDDEAMRYAVAMVFGHEMCHGFDAIGAHFDAVGSLVDWWTEEDRAEFERQQQMVSLYDQLWQYEGVHADGKKTLTENMADLGGVRLAFEIYKQKLTADGLNREAINHQLREFFLHYALLWQGDSSTEALAQQLAEDSHSANHNRIIGITRLMDEWYDLFNVTDGQWYLSPADRVKIW